MKCSIIDCERPKRVRGLCQTHYARAIGQKSIKSMHKARFGGMREFILERDGYKCLMCGMTNEEHKLRWNRSLTINHIDKQGRYSKIVNNDPANLETLCFRCHGHKDATHHGRYSKYQPKMI